MVLAFLMYQGMGIYSVVHECEKSSIWKEQIFGQRRQDARQRDET